MTRLPSPFLTADEAAAVRRTLGITIDEDRRRAALTISTTGTPVAVADAAGGTVPPSAADSQEVAA